MPDKEFAIPLPDLYPGCMFYLESSPPFKVSYANLAFYHTMKLDAEEFSEKYNSSFIALLNEYDREVFSEALSDNESGVKRAVGKSVTASEEEKYVHRKPVAGITVRLNGDLSARNQENGFESGAVTRWIHIKAGYLMYSGVFSCMAYEETEKFIAQDEAERYLRETAGIVETIDGMFLKACYSNGIIEHEFIGGRQGDISDVLTEQCPWISREADDTMKYFLAMEEQLPNGGYNLTYRLRDGHDHRWLQEKGTLVGGDGDGGLNYVSICNDITELKRLEENLRHDNEKEGVLLLAGKNAYFEYDFSEKTICLTYSGSSEDGDRGELKAFVKKVSIEGFLNECVAPEYRAGVMRNVLNAEEAKKLRTGETNVYKVMGHGWSETEYKWYEGIFGVNFDWSSKPTGVYGLIKDIQEDEHLRDETERRNEADAETGALSIKSGQKKFNGMRDREGTVSAVQFEVTNYADLKEKLGTVHAHFVLSGLVKLVRTEMKGAEVYREGQALFAVHTKENGSDLNFSVKRVFNLFTNLYKTRNIIVNLTVGVATVSCSEGWGAVAKACAARRKALTLGNFIGVYEDGDEDSFECQKCWEDIDDGNTSEYLKESAISSDVIPMMLHTRDSLSAIEMSSSLIGLRYGFSMAEIFRYNFEDHIISRYSSWRNPIYLDRPSNFIKFPRYFSQSEESEEAGIPEEDFFSIFGLSGWVIIGEQSEYLKYPYIKDHFDKCGMRGMYIFRLGSEALPRGFLAYSTHDVNKLSSAPLTEDLILSGMFYNLFSDKI